MSKSLFLEHLKKNETQKALAFFLEFSQEDQVSVLSYYAQLINSKKQISINPKMIAFLRRDLREGKTYQEFESAWLPDAPTKKIDDQKIVDYYKLPVQVINAQSVQNPKELISIGLVDASQEEIIKEAQKNADADAARRKQTAEVTEKGSVGLYKVMGSYILGK